MKREPYARLQPVCEASNVHSCNYSGGSQKDADNRLPCPICKKVVKLRKDSTGPWANTIPYHHIPQSMASRSA